MAIRRQKIKKVRLCVMMETRKIDGIGILLPGT